MPPAVVVGCSPVCELKLTIELRHGPRSGFLSGGQVHDEPRAADGRDFDGDGAAVLLHDRLHDREADAEPPASRADRRRDG